jgi:hypothetical protein
MVDAAATLGVPCSVAIRHDGEETIIGAQSPTTELERSVIRQLSTMGRLVQFKNRLAINRDKVSIVVNNLPDNLSDQTDRIRDYLAALAGTTEALCENVSMRRESSARAEQMQIALLQAVSGVNSLRESQHQMAARIRMLLQELTDKVELSYSWMAADRKQEVEMNEAMRDSVESILQVLLNSTQLDEQFEQIISNLRGKDGGQDVELF